MSSGKVSCYTTNFYQLLNLNLMKKKDTPGQQCDDQKVPRDGEFDSLQVPGDGKFGATIVDKSSCEGYVSEPHQSCISTRFC